MHKKKKLISVVLGIVLFVTANSISFAQFSDMNSHWAKDEVLKLSEEKVVSGYPDGTYKPNRTITKGEFFTILNRVLNYNIESVESPDAPITRGEVIKVLGQAFDIKGQGDKSSLGFTDKEQIPEDIVEYLKGMKEEGYISGYADGSFKPDNVITRAEIAKILNNICKDIYNSEDVYTGTVEGNLVLNGSETKLKDVLVKGNLYIASKKGIEGKNVKVEGKIIILGGTEGNVVLEDSTASKVIINKDHINLELKNVSVDEILISAKDTTINSDKESKIGKIKAEEDVKFNGETVNKGGEITPVLSTIPSTPSSGNSGGGGNSDNGGNSDGGSSGGGNSGGGTTQPEEKTIKAEFHKYVLDNFGEVSIKITGIDGAKKFSVAFKYSDGTTEDTVGPVNIGENTTAIFYDGKNPVTITIYGEDGVTPIHVFEDVTLSE
ncbi:MAG: S-layer homology domain-containing protein [Tissierellaceae bacterium]|jgi:mannan endo-1,4-beta-mannosidase|nr:S-layer homology domain-containing protein [Tissierellaceae bacterium]